MTTGILNSRIAETPIAVIDFETTGLVAGYDRVIEVSVVRLDPGESPRLVFDSLINPERPVAATEIHGITDEDVENAPAFRDIAGEVLESCSGCVVAAYNVYFDIKFLHSELAEAGVDHQTPHFCVMYMRPMLGLGGRCKLEEACRVHGIPYNSSHVASHDALAAGNLLRHYWGDLGERGVNTFADLSALKKYKFSESFGLIPFPKPETFGLKRIKHGDKILSRSGFAVKEDPVQRALGSYWEMLKAVLSDLEVSDSELAEMHAERSRGGLKEEQIRVLHAKAMASLMMQFASDQWLDDGEARKLTKLHHCLAKLGWAPGM